MPADMAALCRDLRAETGPLDEILEDLDASAWSTPTPAPGWTVQDQISHLAFFDEAALLAATDPERFVEERNAAIADVDSFTERIAAAHRDRDGRDVLMWFRAARAALLDTFVTIDPSRRVPWFGPDMSTASSLTARIMETWAHGQDVTDALGVDHVPSVALRHVAFIGVRALPNSFLTRGRPVPSAPVRVELTGPEGDRWEFGPPDAHDVVRGPALDFCLVVTQRRHLADTALATQGPVATEWMTIAQAFAGPPGEGRRPGQFQR